MRLRLCNDGIAPVPPRPCLLSSAPLPPCPCLLSSAPVSFCPPPTVPVKIRRARSRHRSQCLQIFRRHNVTNVLHCRFFNFFSILEISNRRCNILCNIFPLMARLLKLVRGLFTKHGLCLDAALSSAEKSIRRTVRIKIEDKNG